MDVGEVRQLVATISRAGDDLRQAGDAVATQLARTWWCGPDADAFRATWGRRRDTLDGAATALDALRDALVGQIRDQQATSEASGHVTVPSTTAVPPVVSGLGPFGDLLPDGVPLDVEELEALLRDRGDDARRWLAWLAGPDGPSIEDHVPWLGRFLGGVGIDAALALSPALAAVVFATFGFRYVPGQDFYTTQEHSIQSLLGFHDAYDELHKLGGMDLDDKVVTFRADGKEYRLEMWKGGYGGGTSFGGEIGIYTRRPDETGLRQILERIPGYSSAARDEDQLHMTQTIYDRHTGERYFTNDGLGSRDGDHYWNLAIRTSPGVRREDLGQMGTLHVPDPDVRREMAAAMRREGLEIVVDDDAGTVDYVWE